jgi:hypothetical protein
MRTWRRLWMQRLLRLGRLLDLAAWISSTLMLMERLLTRIVSGFQMLESVFDVMHIEFIDDM